MPAIIMTADGYCHASGQTGIRKLKALIVSTTGATVGDVVVIREGGPTGAVRSHVTVGAANGTGGYALGGDSYIPVYGDLYYSEQATAAGKIRTTVVWE